MHRSSEILALKWSDILWGEERIRLSKRWAKGADGETKTDASATPHCSPVLAGHLRAWQRQTPHATTDDFVFPSIREKGRKLFDASSFVADHLRPAAEQAGVQIADGPRFGLQNLRHSPSNWLVNKAKIEPKTVQGILRHSKIQATLDLYTQEEVTKRGRRKAIGSTCEGLFGACTSDHGCDTTYLGEISIVAAGEFSAP